ncbi:MAG: cytochrome-c peroxidase [Gammaproteobacteria bacterium]|nr:MAG: cytochrome-c peroxidase [Gammaproteobacteria bacterium]HDY82984.1 cytochrome-c peroxidase [Halieaceae bacterium]
MNRLLYALLLASLAGSAHAAPLGLPEVPVPADNPQTADKIKLGDKLFHDTRFSTTGEVSCSTCHAREKGFTDQLRVSEGINKLTGTRNAPTVINAAYMQTQFWDGREPDLEGQSKQPPLNPVEMGLKDYQPILKIVRSDPEYIQQFKKVFGQSISNITIDHVAKAIAAFERTVIAGNSPFDRHQYGGETKALNESQQRGLAVFLGKGRCVSCHRIEQTTALFIDNRFHNIGIGFKRMQGQEAATAAEFIRAKRQGADVDITVLTQENMSELGRFAVTENPTEIGAFKTPTLRNIEVTQPYMHDGSLKTLEDVVTFYNNGGREQEKDPLSPFMSGGIKPLDLTEGEQTDLVAFLKALTSPEYAPRVAETATKEKTHAKN